MPIYEYLCQTCNRVYSFMARSFTVDREPVCPRCGASDLTKQVSRFAVIRGGEGPHERGGVKGMDVESGVGEPDPLDDPRTERELMRLVQEAEHLDENDPRQMGRFMRRMSELTGEPMDEQMEEAVRRLEAGEDMERIEEDLGDVLGGGDESGSGEYGPTYDDGLYPM